MYQLTPKHPHLFIIVTAALLTVFITFITTPHYEEASLSLFDLNYPTKAQLQSKVIPTKFNPDNLTIYELIAKCDSARFPAGVHNDPGNSKLIGKSYNQINQDDADNESNTNDDKNSINTIHHNNHPSIDTAHNCDLNDPVSKATKINYDQYHDCKAVHHFLTEEFQFCLYDTSQTIEKSKLIQPLDYIIAHFGTYFDHFRANSPDKSISIPTTMMLSDLNIREHYLKGRNNHRRDDWLKQNCPKNDPKSANDDTKITTKDKSSHQHNNTNTSLSQCPPEEPKQVIKRIIKKEDDINYVYSHYLSYYATLQLPLLQKHIQFIQSIFGIFAKSGTKQIDGIYSKSHRSTILEKEPWFNIYYIRDALRAKVRITSMEQIRPILGFFLLHGYTIVQSDLEKFTSPKGFWGWRPIAFDLRAPVNNHMVFEELDEKDVNFGSSSKFHHHQHTVDSNNNDEIITGSSSSKSAQSTLSTSTQSTLQQHHHPPLLYTPTNTGFIIELYFVPEDMDLKSVKGSNHHLYEKWRNSPLLPIFQGHLQNESDQYNLGIKGNVIPLNTLLPYIKDDVDRYVEKNRDDDDNDDDDDDELEKVKDPITTTLGNNNNINLDPNTIDLKKITLEQIQSLWVDYQNDVLTSSLAYTSALEHWILNTKSQSNDNNQIDDDCDWHDRLQGTITGLENQFNRFIEKNLKFCRKECKSVWLSQAQRDLENYTVQPCI